MAAMVTNQKFMKKPSLQVYLSGKDVSKDCLTEMWIYPNYGSNFSGFD